LIRLLIAKLHKLHERLEHDSAKQASAPRASNKDALDILRLLRGISTQELCDRIISVMTVGSIQEIAQQSIAYLEFLFCNRTALGTLMAVDATSPLEDPEEITQSCVILSTDLLSKLRETD